jgi:hypothetical protein
LVTPSASRAATVSTEEELRHRARDFNQALFSGEYDVAVTFVDPDLKELADPKVLKEEFRKVMETVHGVNSALGRRFNKLRVHKVTLDKDKPQATVVMFMSSSDKSGGAIVNGPLPPQRWVLKKNTWYWIK